MGWKRVCWSKHVCNAVIRPSNWSYTAQKQMIEGQSGWHRDTIHPITRYYQHNYFGAGIIRGKIVALRQILQCNWHDWVNSMALKTLFFYLCYLYFTALPHAHYKWHYPAKVTWCDFKKMREVGLHCGWDKEKDKQAFIMASERLSNKVINETFVGEQSFET